MVHEAKIVHFEKTWEYPYSTFLAVDYCVYQHVSCLSMSIFRPPRPQLEDLSKSMSIRMRRLDDVVLLVVLLSWSAINIVEEST